MHKIAHGAEAVLYKDNETIIKERLSKVYRICEIDDKLRKFRTRREAKVLNKLQQLKFPSPHCLDMSDKNMTITMDFVKGRKVKDMLTIELGADIGKNLALLHENDIIHGDLTTSNMIFDNKVNFIDFGLSFFSNKVEDKAVDLFLLDRALATTHSDLYPEIFESIVERYTKQYPEAQAVLQRFEQVKSRGRNKKR